MNIAAISLTVTVVGAAVTGAVYIEKDKATKLEVAQSAKETKVLIYEQEIQTYYEKIDDIDARAKEDKSYSTDAQKKRDAERAIERRQRNIDELTK